MIAQQGQHTFCTNIYADHGQIIGKSLGKGLKKLVIDSSKKREFLLRLRRMNITANSLFPGLDGLGRSIAELIHVQSYRDRVVRPDPVPADR